MTTPGRPTKYNDQVAQKIVDRIAEGESLRSICDPVDMPSEALVRAWCIDDRNGFAARFWRARRIQAMKRADEIEDLAELSPELAEDGKIDPQALQLRRLRIDTRKWILGKLLPDIYGDRMRPSRQAKVEQRRADGDSRL